MFLLLYISLIIKWQTTYYKFLWFEVYRYEIHIRRRIGHLYCYKIYFSTS